MKVILALFLICLIAPAFCWDVTYSSNGTCSDADESTCLSCFIAGNATATPPVDDVTKYFEIFCNATESDTNSACQVQYYSDAACTTVDGAAQAVPIKTDDNSSCDGGCGFFAEDSSNTWIWIVLVIVAVVVVLVIAGVAGFFIYKKRQAAKSQALYE